MNIKLVKKIIVTILIVSILILIGMISYDYYDMKNLNKYTEGMIDEINKIIDDNKKVVVAEKKDDNNDSDTSSSNNSYNKDIKKQTIKRKTVVAQVDDYKVHGKIKIDKIGIEYPILEYKNSNALWKSICKISNNNLDGTGNLCLAGHNMRNLSMFGNLRKLTQGDKIKITNLIGEEFVYEVYEKMYINPNQTEVLNDTDEPIVTLITCNDASNKRLIVKGKLI